jgi:hypothetical protein
VADYSLSSPGLIDSYLAQVRGGLAKRRSERILAEIEDHLRERADQLMTAGDRDPYEAESEAVNAFGDPAVIARSFNDEGGAMPTKFTHWSGLCGMMALPVMLLSSAVTPEPSDPTATDSVPVLLPLVLALIIVGFAGLVARTRGAFGRTRGTAISVCLVLGIVLSPISRGGLLAGAIVAGLMLAALALLAEAIIREAVLPRPATIMFVAAVMASSVLSPTSLEKQSLPYYLCAAAGATGWMWLHYTLWSERPAPSRVQTA